MQPKIVTASSGNKVLLFDDADLEETIKRQPDAKAAQSEQLRPQIEKYLSERSSHGGSASAPSRRDDKGMDKGKKPAEADEGDDEDLEADYDCMSRGTVKAKSSALSDVMNGIEGVKISHEPKKKSSGGGKPPVAKH
jgi:hypothetical protein